VSVVPYEGGIRVTYDGETLESFAYELEGPNGSVYNVSRDFEEPTDYFQTDLNDTVTDNASEDSEDYTIDYNATTWDGEEWGGELEAGENTGLSFGGSTGSSGGGGGGIVADDAGSDAPLVVTAVPAVAAIGYALYRRRRRGGGP